MTDTTARPASSAKVTRTGLAALNVAELKGVASGLGITGTTKMRKDDLVAAIASRQSGGSGSAAERPEPRRSRRAGAAATNESAAATNESAATTNGGAASAAPAAAAEAPSERAESIPDGRGHDRGGARSEHTSAGQDTAVRDEREGEQRAEGDHRSEGDQRPTRSGQQDRRQDRGAQQDRRQHDRDAEQDRQQSPYQERRQHDREAQQDRRSQDRDGQQEREQDRQQGPAQDRQSGQGGADRAAERNADKGEQQGNQGASAGQAGRYDDEDGRGGRRRNRQRSRDRKRSGRPATGGSQDFEPEVQLNDDDVLVPVAGILDVLDNYAFVRTSGYLPGVNDVYVPLGVVKKNGLRKGDAVTGAVKALRDGESPQGGAVNRQKFNALVRLDSINGQTPEQSRARVEFGKLTPLYPQERLRLETEPGILTTRIIDLIAPIGKGQRGLIVAPSKAGKTMVMQALANAVTANNPECHLMVVLVDERPEEVTDMQRAVKGEVIASTFDRPAEDHTTVAELAIERAKRLVELGHDVVVLLDSITKLGRAYNLAAPASGRILSGGVDSAALYPPKKFFGAARNIENGGSLTILATALVETGSRMDEVIFEEFKGTGNMELRLSRELANRRIFPAVDVNNSSTRREEILLGAEELKIMWKLRRVLAALDSQQGIELLLDRLKKTKSNVDFLRQIQLTSSSKLDGDD